jgi:hypothetical protein
MNHLMLVALTTTTAAAMLATSFVSGVFAAPHDEDRAPSASTAATSPISYSVDDVRASFLDTALQIEAPHAWSWSSSPVTSMQMRDADGQVLLALIYTDSNVATLAREQAEADERRTSGGTAIAGSPHLVEGYGPSVWYGNVALVQAAQSDLNRLYQQTIDRANGIEASTAEIVAVSTPLHAVDFDFQQALDQHLANL